ncbi:hypothetical protein [Ekhidna sp.]|uniref:hypothetical protein n=1 Tax=Ekhidna sp. TaxID=2608089 RepID=UPI0032992268
MKKLQGIFDRISEEYHSDISDPSKVIKDQLVYNSSSKENKEFPIERSNLSTHSRDTLKAISSQKQKKTTDLFQLPDFTNNDMNVDTKEMLNSGIDKLDTNDEAIKAKKAVDSLDDDLMKVESKKWHSKFNKGFDV